MIYIFKRLLWKQRNDTEDTAIVQVNNDSCFNDSTVEVVKKKKQMKWDIF